MPDKLVEEGQVVKINGVDCKILSVGEHFKDDVCVGYSYSFRPVAEMEADDAVVEEAKESKAETAEPETPEE